MCDTGIACALLGDDVLALQRDRALLGDLLETFVLMELERQGSSHAEPLSFYRYRDRDGFEVDIVLERGAHSIAGVEVKVAATLTEGDFRSLRKLRDATGRAFVHGVVLHDGEACIPFGDRLHAVPLSTLWAGR